MARMPGTVFSCGRRSRITSSALSSRSARGLSTTIIMPEVEAWTMNRSTAGCSWTIPPRAIIRSTSAVQAMPCSVWVETMMKSRSSAGMNPLGTTLKSTPVATRMAREKAMVDTRWRSTNNRLRLYRSTSHW